MKSATLVGLALTVALTSGTVSTAAGQNLLTNPGFETGDYAGYFTFGAGVQMSTPETDNIALTGSFAAKVFGEFTGCPFPTFDVGGFGQSFAAVPGKVYEFRGAGFVSSVDSIPGETTCANNRMIAQIVFRNASNTIVSRNEVIVGGPLTPLETWIEFDVSAPAPANAVTVEALILFLQPACDEGSVFVDDLEFEAKDPVPATNRLANPSFATAGFGGWEIFGNVVAETRTTLMRTADGGAAIFGTFVENEVSGLTQNVPVTPGENVEFAGWTLNTCEETPIEGTNANLGLARIEFRDALGALVGETEAIVADATSPLGRWTRYSIVAQAPAEATSADVFFLFVQPVSTEGGKFFIDDFRFGEFTATSVDGPITARSAQLAQNSPNPFNPITEIAFALDQGDRIALHVYDATGRLVTTLVSGDLPAGRHSVIWNGTNDAGELVASGVYRYVLNTSLGRTARSMVLLK